MNGLRRKHRKQLSCYYPLCHVFRGASVVAKEGR